MARTYWQTDPHTEWLPLAVVQNMIQGRTAFERDDILARCKDSRIRSRVVNGELQVADDALLGFLDTLPPVPPAPEVFVKLGNRAYREIETPRGTILQKL